MHGKRLMTLIVDGSGNISPFYKWETEKPTAWGVKNWAEVSASCFVAGFFVILCRYSRSLEMLCPAGKYSSSWVFCFCFSPFLQNALWPIISLFGKQTAEKETIVTKPLVERLCNLFTISWIKLSKFEVFFLHCKHTTEHHMLIKKGKGRLFFRTEMFNFADHIL